jgi:hypothetical protein
MMEFAVLVVQRPICDVESKPSQTRNQRLASFVTEKGIGSDFVGLAVPSAESKASGFSLFFIQKLIEGLSRTTYGYGLVNRMVQNVSKPIDHQLQMFQKPFSSVFLLLANTSHCSKEFIYYMIIDYLQCLILKYACQTVYVVTTDSRVLDLINGYYPSLYCTWRVYAYLLHSFFADRSFADLRCQDLESYEYRCQGACSEINLKISTTVRKKIEKSFLTIQDRLYADEMMIMKDITSSPDSPNHGHDSSHRGPRESQASSNYYLNHLRSRGNPAVIPPSVSDLSVSDFETLIASSVSPLVEVSEDHPNSMDALGSGAALTDHAPGLSMVNVVETGSSPIEPPFGVEPPSSEGFMLAFNSRWGERKQGRLLEPDPSGISTSAEHLSFLEALPPVTESPEGRLG